MPPPKTRAGPDDSRSEASSTKERQGNGNPAPAVMKARRTVGSAIANGSSLKDVVTANNAAAAATNPSNNKDGASGVSHNRKHLTPSYVLLIGDLRRTYADFMGLRRHANPSILQTCLPPQHAFRVWQVNEPDHSVQPGHRSVFPNDGSQARAEKGEQGPARAGSEKEFQRVGDT